MGIGCPAPTPEGGKRRSYRRDPRRSLPASIARRIGPMNAHALPDIAFPGRDKLVNAIDAAVGAGDEHAITAALRNTLCRMIRDRDVALPECVFEPIEDHYARREIYRSPEHGYSVVAMTWGPGQGTPVQCRGPLSAASIRRSIRCSALACQSWRPCRTA